MRRARSAVVNYTLDQSLVQTVRWDVVFCTMDTLAENAEEYLQKDKYDSLD